MAKIHQRDATQAQCIKVGVIFGVDPVRADAHHICKGKQSIAG